jgi:alpha-N-arabinofuranosidase
VGEIDPMIYGGFIEHMGRCIYGGIFDPGNSLRMRMDSVPTSCKPYAICRCPFSVGRVATSHPAIIGWRGSAPGKPSPPDRSGLGWRGSNAVGTDEFIEYCRRVGPNRISV